MRVLSDSAKGIAEALKVLRLGGIVAHATETCYGLACDMTNAVALIRLFSVKERPADQPASALFASVDDAKSYVVWSPRAEELSQDLPGPLTIILPMQPAPPTTIFTTADGKPPATLAIRVSPHPVAIALVRSFGTPLSTTSANIHGKPSPYSAAEIVEQFHDRKLQPDLILDSGPLSLRKPSRIVDCTGTTDRIIRK